MTISELADKAIAAWRNSSRCLTFFGWRADLRHCTLHNNHTGPCLWSMSWGQVHCPELHKEIAKTDQYIWW